MLKKCWGKRYTISILLFSRFIISLNPTLLFLFKFIVYLVYGIFIGVHLNYKLKMIAYKVFNQWRIKPLYIYIYIY